MAPHPLTNFEVQKYYQNGPKSNRIYSRDKPPKTKFQEKIKNGAYVINLDEYSDIGTHWIALYVLNNNVTYLDSFGVEHIPKIIRKFIDKSIVVKIIFRKQAYHSVMRECIYIGFIDFMIAGKILTDITNLFSPNIFF